jgi:serine/threonine protein kinase
MEETNNMIEGNLKLIEKIKEGTSSIIFTAENVDQANVKYAVKRLDKFKMNQTAKADYNREIAIMKKLSGHPNIVQYINNFETVNFFYLVLEYCETDLFDAIFLRCGFPPALVKRFFSDIATGLAYAHKNGIYHRDIKV